MKALKRALVRVLLVFCAVALVTALTEEVLERSARARLTGGQTFADVNGASVRYRLLGAEHPGVTVVFLTGLGGSIEQMEFLQTRVAATNRTLSYDRGGYGFSQGSRAYTAEQQVEELFGLLDVLHLRDRVVLVGFSSSAAVARVFAARHPERTAGLYFVEPYFPEVELKLPGRKSPRRSYARWILHDFFTTTFGWKRLHNRLQDFAGPSDPVEARAEEVLQSRRHFWAMAHEWYAIPETAAETLAAPVGREPVVVLVTKQPDSAEARATDAVYAEYVQRSPAGKLVELPNYDHAKLITPGPVLDTIVAGIRELTGPAPH